MHKKIIEDFKKKIYESANETIINLYFRSDKRARNIIIIIVEKTFQNL